MKFEVKQWWAVRIWKEKIDMRRGPYATEEQAMEDNKYDIDMDSWFIASTTETFED